MPENLDFETELRDALRAEPFVPFTIVVASGDRYRIMDAARIATGADVVTIAEPVGSVIIRLYNIVSFEFHESL